MSVSSCLHLNIKIHNKKAVAERCGVSKSFVRLCQDAGRLHGCAYSKLSKRQLKVFGKIAKTGAYTITIENDLIALTSANQDATSVYEAVRATGDYENLTN